MQQPDAFHIACLKQDIESKVGRPIHTSSDFDFLFRALKHHQPDVPSVSTLKRLWAYTSHPTHRSLTTLNNLSRFLGHKDWNGYIESLIRMSRVESGYLDTKTILSHDLKPGDEVDITWNPSRTLRARYLGDNRFVVCSSVNSSLTSGATFSALVFAVGTPLCCTNLRNSDTGDDVYVAGSRTGLTSVRLHPCVSDK